jgi:hypothetical protein
MSESCVQSHGPHECRPDHDEVNVVRAVSVLCGHVANKPSQAPPPERIVRRSPGPDRRVLAGYSHYVHIWLTLAAC